MASGLACDSFFRVQPEPVVVFALGRDEAAVHPFFLKPQHHHHVHVFQPLFHVAENLDPELVDLGRHQCRWPDQAHAVLHLAQQHDVRPRDAAVRDIAADRDRQPVQASLGPSDRQCIEQRLGGMFMCPIARIQHRAIHLLRQQVDRTGRRMPHDQQVGVHRVQRQCGVDQRLALFHAGCLHRHVHHVRTQPQARQFETGLRAGRVFEEHVDLRHARQHVLVRHTGAVVRGIAVGQIEQRRDLVRLEMFDGQKVAGAKGHGAVTSDANACIIGAGGMAGKPFPP